MPLFLYSPLPRLSLIRGFMLYKVLKSHDCNNRLRKSLFNSFLKVSGLKYLNASVYADTVCLSSPNHRLISIASLDVYPGFTKYTLNLYFIAITTPCSNSFFFGNVLSFLLTFLLFVFLPFLLLILSKSSNNTIPTL